jgi:hypothetical protein
VYTKHNSGSSKASQPRWILVIGAFGIVFGLAMYGYRIIAVSALNYSFQAQLHCRKVCDLYIHESSGIKAKTQAKILAGASWSSSC